MAQVDPVPLRRQGGVVRQVGIARVDLDRDDQGLDDGLPRERRLIRKQLLEELHPLAHDLLGELDRLRAELRSELIVLQLLLGLEIVQFPEAGCHVLLRKRQVLVLQRLEEPALLALEGADFLLDGGQALLELPLGLLQGLVVRADELGQGLLARQAFLEPRQKHPLQIVGVEGALGAGAASALTHDRIADVVAIASAAAVRDVAHEAGPAESAPHQPGEQVIAGDRPRMRGRRVAAFQHPLHPVPVGPADDRLVAVLHRDRLQRPVHRPAAAVQPLAEGRIAHVFFVAEDAEDEVLAEWVAASVLDPVGVQAVPDGVDALALEIHGKDPAHDFGFRLLDGQLALGPLLGLDAHQRIAERRVAPVPPPVPGILRHPLQAFSGQIQAVELIHPLEDGFQDHFGGIAGAEDWLGGGGDADALAAENVLVLDRVVAVTGEAIQLVDQDHLERRLAAGRLADHLLEGRPGIGRPGFGLIDVDLVDRPALLLGEGEALPPLRFDGHRVALLLGGVTAVDGATRRRGCHRAMTVG